MKKFIFIFLVITSVLSSIAYAAGGYYEGGKGSSHKGGTYTNHHYDNGR